MPYYNLADSSRTVVRLKRNKSLLRKISIEVGNVPGRTILTYAYPVPVRCSNNPDAAQLYEIPTYTLEVSGTDDDGHSSTNTWEIYRFGVYNNDGSNKEYDNRGLFVAGLADDQTWVIDKFDPSYSVHSARSVELGAWHIHKGFLIHDGPDIPMTKTNFYSPGLYASVGCIEICGTNRGFERFNKFIVDLSGTTKSGTAALIEIGSARVISVHYKKAERPPLKPYNP